MARYITTVHTAHAPEKAFAMVADLANFERWDPGVLASVQVRGDGPGLDAAYDVTVKSFTGGEMVLTYEVAEFEPDQRVVAIADTANLRSYDVITVEPSDDVAPGGAAVTYDAELELKGVLRPGNLGLGAIFNKIGDKAAAGLREYLG